MRCSPHCWLALDRWSARRIRLRSNPPLNPRARTRRQQHCPTILRPLLPVPLLKHHQAARIPRLRLLARAKPRTRRSLPTQRAAPAADSGKPPARATILTNHPPVSAIPTALTAAAWGSRPQPAWRRHWLRHVNSQAASIPSAGPVLAAQASADAPATPLLFFPQAMAPCAARAAAC